VLQMIHIYIYIYTHTHIHTHIHTAGNWAYRKSKRTISKYKWHYKCASHKLYSN